MCQIWSVLCAAHITDDDYLHRICQNVHRQNASIMRVSFVETIILFPTIPLCYLAYIRRCIDFISIAIWCHDLYTPLLFHSNFMFWILALSMILQIFVSCKSCETKTIHIFFNVIKLRHQKIASQIAIQYNYVLLVFCKRE